MAEDSKIQWTHHTFNPWSGCAKAHTGCLNCYAEHSPPSMRRQAKWGTAAQGATRVPASEEYMRQPLKWARAAAKAGERHRVFCGSMMDVLEVTRDATLDAIMDAQRAKLWDIIRDTACVCGECGMAEHRHVQRGYCAGTPTGAARRMGGLDYLLLTKRPENWRLVPEDVRPLVWLGTSISDQKTADEWVPRLLEAESFRYRFLSVEPLVGWVDLFSAVARSGVQWGCAGQHRGIGTSECPSRLHHHHDARCRFPIDWVICGGESGHGARECREEWVRDIVRQCREAGTRCFVKQMGRRWAEARGLMEERTKNGVTKLVPDTHGGRPETWPEDLRVQEFPHG